jgi:hypothetical protein
MSTFFPHQLPQPPDTDAQAEADERLWQHYCAVAKQLNVGRVVLKIDGDGPVFSRRFGRCAQVSPPGHQVSSADETRWGSHVEISRQS